MKKDSSGVNFINIICALLLPISLRQKIMKPKCNREKLRKALLYGKCARKMLMKSTPVVYRGVTSQEISQNLTLL